MPRAHIGLLNDRLTNFVTIIFKRTYISEQVNFRRWCSSKHITDKMSRAIRFRVKISS